MAKFEQKLQELGLQESELSVSCKNLINDYRYGIEQIPTLEEENQGGELDKDINELIEELDELDDKIVGKIQYNFDNREAIELKKANLKRGRPKKNATEPTATPTPTPTPKATATPQTTATPQATATPNAEPTKKKGIGFGTILLVIGGTILGVSLLKNRN